MSEGGRADAAVTGLDALRHPATIRLRCRAVLDAVADERSALWRVDRSRLDAVAARVAALTRRRFPDLRVPLHSRWRHFEAGGVDRKAELDRLLQGRDAFAVACAQVDLTVTSVLLDAGTGGRWRYRDRDDRDYTRSEGLAVASLRAFFDGRFSAVPGEPLRVDARALASLDAATLGTSLQVGPDNPLLGLEGRAALLRRLGEALAAMPRKAQADAHFDVAATSGRPAVLLERLSAGGTRREVAASDLLAEVLRLTEAVFVGGAKLGGRSAGDVWPHRFAGDRLPGRDHGDPSTSGFVPFHKLAQWLAYSLVEPLQWTGLRVTDLDALTGLPEYRNGGLLIDEGVLVPRDARLLERTHQVGDEAVVEWRALTVALLDELAPRVRALLGADAAALPLACLLEGGTWAAGREVAAERRADAAPPLRIASDGTVF